MKRFHIHVSVPNWVTDPTGIAWEMFHTLGAIAVYGEDSAVFGHGASTVPVSISQAPCSLPASRSEPANHG